MRGGTVKLLAVPVNLLPAILLALQLSPARAVEPLAAVGPWPEAQQEWTLLPAPDTPVAPSGGRQLLLEPATVALLRGSETSVTGSGPQLKWAINLQAPGSGFPYVPTVFDADGDGAAEIFLTGGNTFGIRGDGTFLPGWPTREQPYMGYGTNESKPGPSVADVDRDGDLEITWTLRDWWAGTAHMWCFNGKNFDGTNMPGFPQYAPNNYSNALEYPFVLGDTNGDGKLEAWGAHTLGNTGDYYRISAFNHLGTRLFTVDLPSPQNVKGLYYGDIDGNGTREVFAVAWASPTFYLHVFNPDGSEQPGYPIPVLTLGSGWLMFGYPVPVDLDEDGDLEILFGHWDENLNSWVHGRHHDGSNVAGFPKLIATESQLYFIGLGDVTGDGRPELIATDNWFAGTDRVHVLDLDSGQPLPGFPYETGSWPHSFPTVADIDGDGNQDVIVSTSAGQVIALDKRGQLLPGFPLQMIGASIGGVAVGDIDGDGLFEIVSSTWNGWVYAWDVPGPAGILQADWPLRSVNARNTGVFGDRDWPLGDLNCDGQVNAFDIDPFSLALTDPVAYRSQYRGCNIMLADVNGDGAANAFDIDPFVDLLTGR